MQERFETFTVLIIAYEEICEKIQEYIKHTGLVFMLKSLKNFAANGRASPLVAKLVGFAGICIVGKASDEELWNLHTNAVVRIAPSKHL